MNEIVRGALISGSLIVAIGAQNVFVLKQGLLKNNIFWVALTCFLCDFILMTLGILGVGSIISSNEIATVILAVVGGLFLLFYGFKSFRSSWLATSSLEIQSDSKKTPIYKTIAVTLAITLLNPHVYLDTLVVIGGVAGTLAWDAKLQFLIGTLLASFIWFFALGYGSRWLIPFFKKPSAWRILDFFIGCVMFLIAYQLLKFAAQTAF
ncbi:LysE/ArgO family amino acid transporter [Kurthia zopfii]|uniref:LysE/ArgO family amino acid transporter n=1 Tax=Kurthia zopfii TaxID=1650 RepID=UPI000F6D4FFA|nr:LysE/ArgO family amino acid transporter [Kurthia zopfii]VEI05014.1 Arginine exporter protein ArgO [Kurthia zopfii]